MAGRPLSRLRSMGRANPLVAWDRKYEGTVGSGDYYYGPMLKSDAEEKFRASMATSDRVLTAKGLLPLPLTLVIRPAVPHHSTEDLNNVAFAGQLAAQTKSVVLFEYVYGRAAERPNKPGDSNRETPHTLFNVLHRLCEFISQSGDVRDGKLWMNLSGVSSGDIAFLPCLPPAIADSFGTAVQLVLNGADLIYSRLHPKEARGSNLGSMQYVRAIVSSGLNTASGRLGAIDDTDQALAEAFAKFCLSTGPVYDPNVPLTLNGKQLPLGYADLEYIQNLRTIWGEILEQTVHSLVKVFGIFVRAHYSGNSPTFEIAKNRRYHVEHIDSEYDHLNDMLPRGLVGVDGQPLAFVAPRTFEETLYATELYTAVRGVFTAPSREQEYAARSVVSEALESFLNYEQRRDLRRSAPPGSAPEYRFLREKYARPRNTAQSIAKAQRVNAALDVLEAPTKPRPGLHTFFIQPNEG